MFRCNQTSTRHAGGAATLLCALADNIQRFITKLAGHPGKTALELSLALGRSYAGLHLSIQQARVLLMILGYSVAS